MKDWPRRPPGGFCTVVADPPWEFQNAVGSGGRSKSNRQYRVMPDEVIAALPVKAIAAENAHLYLWLVAAKAEAAYAACRAWGFRPILELWWFKRAPQLMLVGLPPRKRMGLGFYFRHIGERCLFGVRGRLRLSARNLEALICEAPREHSRKPEAFYVLVEKASPGPRVELFSRHRREGWICWGDETRKFL